MRYLAALLFALQGSLLAHAQSFELSPSAPADDGALAASMSALAERVSVVIVLAINKQRDLQINYPSGRDISDETLADATEPLQIKWFGDSYVDVPLSK